MGGEKNDTVIMKADEQLCEWGEWGEWGRSLMALG